MEKYKRKSSLEIVDRNLEILGCCDCPTCLPKTRASNFNENNIIQKCMQNCLYAGFNCSTWFPPSKLRTLVFCSDSETLFVITFNVGVPKS